MIGSASNGQSDDGLGEEQPFLSHLVELRDRLLRMVVAVLIVFVVLFPFGNDIYTMIAEPIRAQLPEGSQMIATQVASPFLTPFKLALVAAVFLAMPYLLYQLWAFVAPGLYTHEKRLAVPLLTSSIVLFYLGMAFAYFVVFPLVFRFFTSVTPEGVAQMPDIAFYLEFVLKLFFAFGIAFEIPIATILLVAIGATTPEALGRKRPYVIVGVFIAGMLLTPPDVISQTLLAIPMWLLYEAGIFFSRFFQRRAEAGAAGGAPAPDPGQGGGGGLPVTGSGGGAGSSVGFRSTSDPEPEVGRDIDGGDMYEPGRYRPMTAAEMEAELDAIEAEEAAADARDEHDAPYVPGPASADALEALIRQANALRLDGQVAPARALLYRVLEDGDDDQRRVARNILADLDQL
ncbi:twin-arginine translocase subunit TatC [Thiohalocapsa marina]|uniref:twin-arginine translocase subunit TatC n=1 Tax=Thiohalocapsa marina TaxID=424902 RepID=UPI0036DAE16C